MATTASTQKQMPFYDSSTPRIPVITTIVEIVSYRYLIVNLISRDLKVRYKRSVLGFVWVMLNPLLTMTVLAVVFSDILKVRTSHYVTLVLTGILLMNLFAQGSTAAMSSLVGNGALLRKMYVPPSVFVASTVGSALVNFSYALGPALVLAYIDGVRPSPMWAFDLLPIAETLALTMGVGLIVSVLMAYFHDTFEIYQVLLNVLFYGTPVMYPLSLVPQPIRSFETYNPMSQTVSQFRDVFIYGQWPALSDVVVAAVLTFGTLFVGVLIFSRAEQKVVYHV